MKALQIILVLVMFISLQIFAQKEIEKMPEIKGGIQELVKNIKYPESAKKEGITGVVFVKALIDVNGNVASAEIDKGVNDDLNSAALSAVKNTKFIPGEDKGEKVQAEVTIPIKFKLDCKKEKS
jgi:periplasmic protein TonB